MRNESSWPMRLLAGAMPGNAVKKELLEKEW